MLPKAKRLRRNINKTNPVSRVGLIFSFAGDIG